MESKSYKELQALAKLHGIRANLSKAALIDKLTSQDKVPADSDQPVTATADAAHDKIDANAAPLDSEEPEVLAESSERRKNDRLSSTRKVNPAPLDSEEPEVLAESSERRKSDRLSAAKKERQTVSESSRKTKVKQPTAGPARRFERMHQNLFAGQASIETYGKTPKKKTVPAKENVPLSKVTPVRRVVSGSGVKSVKRGLTVASKPCTLVVQRSSKKPTQIKEFRLSSNLSGKREPFKPYSGPVRPMNLANKGASFHVGSSSSASAQVSQKNKTNLGIKATLASGKAKSARKNAHVQSSKVHRERAITQARIGRA